MINYEMNWDIEGDNSKEIIESAYGALVREREDGIAEYYKLPEDSQLLIDEVEAKEASTPEWKEADTLVIIGIGGSSLGAKALNQALRAINPSAKKMIFLENPDPVELDEKFKSIDKNKTLFFLISKSGGTIETTSIYKALIDRFDLDIESKDKERVIVITDKDSILHKYAKKHKLTSYFIPANVGGRFSVLSAVGIAPLTLAGYDTKELLNGAKEIVDAFFAREAEHILQKGAFIAKNWEKYRINVLFAYSSYMEDFTKWFVQLWGESLGKIDSSGKRVGLTPAGHIGSVDQHSFLQLIIEGPRDKTVTFLKIEDFQKDIKIPDISLDYIEKNDYINNHTFQELLNAECDATKESIENEGIPTDKISMDKISEKNLGELILYYELLTSTVGAVLNIDTYNQPGVELGKRILVKKFTKDI